MALVPSRQFYPTSFFDSLQSSFIKFHSSHVHFFRYGSSIPFKKYTFYASHNTVNCSTISEKIPLGNSKFSGTNSPLSQYNHGRNVCQGSWIDKWNKPQKHNRPRQPRAVLNYPSSGSDDVSSSDYGGDDERNGDISYSGGSTMEKIVEKLKKFGYISDNKDNREKIPEGAIEKGSVEDIFYVEEGMLPNTRGGFSAESPLGVETVFGGNRDYGEVKFPWEKAKEMEKREGTSAGSKSRTSLAELTLPESELRRLRNLTFQKKHKMKIGGAGVTQAVVDIIHEKWKSSELVRLKIEGPPALNMRRMHEILERKTGGLVIWRSGTSVSLYRGLSYEVPAPQPNKRIHKRNETSSSTLPIAMATKTTTVVPSEFSYVNNMPVPQYFMETTTEDKKDTEQMSEVKYEDEVDRLLESLGPRYRDWPGCDPLPVDADMLPGIVPGYEPPFRILPYGMRSTLGVREATALRRLARVLPPHFALGRNKQLQGLAVAMVKLWERSSIAKIALKRGVQLTTSERMAEEIKKLTGGMLLSRNKDFLVFYRGKSFLSPEVTEALLERERLARSLQDEEENARLRASALVVPIVEKMEQSRTAGTLGETKDAYAKWGKTLDNRHKEKVMREAEILRHANLVRKLERKLAFAERKLTKAERALSKVEAYLKPAERQADPDSITDEERFMFRKLGLRMKAFLLLGRRGVFDGTVENMHLHWKYRELVKIMVKAKTFDQVKKVALALEAESGGVLVSVDKVSQSYAIIVYRGKDYKRPSMLRPKNLLTKRKALARSIELQRHEAFLKHISALQSKVDKLRSEIEQMETVKNEGDDELYDKLESDYLDDDIEEEGDESDFEGYEEENGGEDDTVYDYYLETNFGNDNEYQISESESEITESQAYAVPYE